MRHHLGGRRPYTIKWPVPARARNTRNPESGTASSLLYSKPTVHSITLRPSYHRVPSRKIPRQTGSRYNSSHTHRQTPPGATLSHRQRGYPRGARAHGQVHASYHMSDTTPHPATPPHVASHIGYPHPEISAPPRSPRPPLATRPESVPMIVQAHRPSPPHTPACACHACTAQYQQQQP